MIIEVIDSNSKYFPKNSEYDFADFVAWLQYDMLPSHLVFRCFGKYWRVDCGYVCCEEDRYSAAAFSLYRFRLGVTEEDETKAKMLNYISTQEDMRYHIVAEALGVSSASIGYHIADLKARGLVDTDPLALTSIGELALVYLNDS